VRPLASRRVPTATVPTKDSGREGTQGAEARRVAGVTVRWCYEGVIVRPVMVAGPRVRDGVGEFSSTNVAMLGELAESHLATFFARAAIGVFPARYEPFGLAVLEAALSECALVLALGE